MSPFMRKTTRDDETRKRAANKETFMLRNTDHLPLLLKMSNGNGALLDNLVGTKNEP